MIKQGVVVVGAGIAGLRAAIEVSEKGADVAVLSKLHPVRSHSNNLPVMHLSQMVGLALGVNAKKLEFSKHRSLWGRFCVNCDNCLFKPSLDLALYMRNCIVHGFNRDSLVK